MKEKAVKLVVVCIFCVAIVFALVELVQFLF
jgi:hypothetical protein